MDEKFFSQWDLCIVSRSDTETIEPAEEFFADLDSLRVQFANEANLNKYIPYTNQLAAIDEDCTRVAYNFLRQVSFVERGYGSLTNNQSAIDTYHLSTQLRKVLEDPYNRVSRRLMKLATTFPPKGRDGPSLVKWHKDTYHISTKEAQIQAIRNFFSGAYCWQFTTVTDQTILDTCGSLLCLSMAVDYAGAADDLQCGEVENFLAAANDGIRSFMGGIHMKKTYNDLIKDCAFIRLKDFITSETYNNKYQKNGSKADWTLTPSRLLELRWVDAAIAPYYRALIGYSSRDMGIECDVNGTPICAEKCVRIRRAIDSVIRYNEIVDILSDIKVKECFNELLIAFSMGGQRSVMGYADALSSVIEDALDCDCEADGHQWAAISAMGIGNYYTVYPRYQVLCQIQLAARDKIPNDIYIEDRWGPLLPYAVQKCKLDNIMLLHRTDWQPGWQFEYATNDAITSTQDDPSRLCSMCWLSAIALSGRILAQSREKAAKSGLPEIIYDLIGCSGKRNANGHYQCVPGDALVHASIWSKMCKNLFNFKCTKEATENETMAAASAILNIVENFCLATWKPWSTDVTMSLIVELFTSLDIVMRTTYNVTVAEDGIWRRKLLMGLVATFMEFSAVRAYASLCEYAFGKDYV